MKTFFYSSTIDAIKRRIPKIKLILFGAFLSCQSLLAAENLTKLDPFDLAFEANTLSLTVAIKNSLQQNPSLKVFDFRETALQGQLQTAQLKPSYELGVDTENLFGSNSFSGVDSAELTVSLSSVIEMGDKLAARSGFVSNSQLHLQAQKQVASLDLLGETTRRYINVLAAQEQLALAFEAVELANASLKIVKQRAQVGATPEAEVKRAQAAAAQAKLGLGAEQQRLLYLKTALAAMWGSMTPEFSTVNGDLFQFGEDIPFDTLYAQVEQNPAIKTFASQVRLKEAEVRLAQTQSSADLSWTIGVRRLQESNDTALVAGFSMPLFASDRNSGAVAAALAEKNEVWVQREVALLDLRTQLFRAFHNRKQAIVTVKTLRASIIPALEQALSETEAAYERGRYGYLEYVSARQELLNARRTLIESASAALTYGAEIEQLTAQSLSASQKDSKNSLLGTNQ